MKIHIRSEERGFTILFPTKLIFSKAVLKYGLKVGKRYSDAVPDISPAAVDALCDEIRRIKKTHSDWELVNIQSDDGKEVQIYL